MQRRALVHLVLAEQAYCAGEFAGGGQRLLPGAASDEQSGRLAGWSTEGAEQATP